MLGAGVDAGRTAFVAMPAFMSDAPAPLAANRERSSFVRECRTHATALLGNRLHTGLTVRSDEALVSASHRREAPVGKDPAAEDP
jgi:hypothetical protein